jgi:DAK2 domain fusion protein YloV
MVRFADIVTARNAKPEGERISAAWDGRAVLRALEAAEARLAKHVDHVNRLNVYPVPDGDTGTNMLHTMRSAVAYARKASGGAGSVVAAAAQGSLMGARGNSGVILSQVFAGMKAGIGDRDEIGSAELIATFARAKEKSYQAVVNPVEGTILTAIRFMSEAVGGREREEPQAILDRAVAAGREATARTPEMLPVLKQAGVVDAGAQGLVYVVEGIADLLAGRTTAEELPAEERIEPAPPAGAVADGRSWGYDVQFLVPTPSRPVPQLREEMLRFGLDDPSLGCVLVVGDESAVKVHVHTEHPHEILRIGLSAGRLHDIVVENLDAMALEHERATGVGVSRADVERRPLAAVAVVSGPGLAAVCRSLGAVPLLAETKPSVAELLHAIEEAPGDAVILLPNDKDVIPAAETAARESSKAAKVIPTRKVTQGIAALVTFDAQGALEGVTTAMTESARTPRTIEIARASRDATVDGVTVKEGDQMALVDGACVGTADTPEEALATAARAMGQAELCTLYTGAGVESESAGSARDRLRDTLGCEVEVVDGGQRHYPYVVSVE